MKRAAVVLSGCGWLDGSEIRESVGALWALSKHGVRIQCFAPDAPQQEVINSYEKKAQPQERRNQLVESARIARGHILPLTQLDPKEFDLLVLPGGYGAAKNLSTFAMEGSRGWVDPALQKIIRGFFDAGKPIGAICIAPAVVALALAGKKLGLTVGTPGEAAQEIEKLGHRHFVTQPTQCHVDTSYKIVSTPAYMVDDAPLHEIFEGIDRMVAEMVRLAR